MKNTKIQFNNDHFLLSKPSRLIFLSDDSPEANKEEDNKILENEIKEYVKGDIITLKKKYPEVLKYNPNVPFNVRNHFEKNAKNLILSLRDAWAKGRDLDDRAEKLRDHKSIQEMFKLYKSTNKEGKKYMEHFFSMFLNDDGIGIFYESTKHPEMKFESPVK